ncbi:ATPase P [Thioalkalivibrio denitrificans]|uniref:ATPase P n=1 Tax=Thioalkalivibrio denitrificans TaxID=108003 RepID=A0A1V3NV39_9GAMM|nr:HAD family hydrolase [Thioalkalivibrio denitrificans]OOG28844.1 ATPase P [Thioalkalivibrio denitrificans]
MLEITIPGGPALALEHLVLDYNGTLAVDGALLPGVAEALEALSRHLRLRVLTADTFGRARDNLAGLPCELIVLDPDAQDQAKLRHVQSLGAGRCVAVGNGRNDCLMLKAAALGICVVQAEGAAMATLLAADVAVPDIHSALGLLRRPQRLVATLRT